MKKCLLTMFAILFVVTTSTFAQNYALSFNNDAEFDFESVDIDSIPAFSALTVELWVKINGNNTNYNIGLIDIDSENDYFFYLVGKRAAWVGKPGQCRTADTVEVDSWHHLALVLEKDTVKAMYIDGVSQGLDEPYSCTNPLKQTWKLGSLYNDSTLALYGSMDELRIWNVARTEQEINDNKDKELTGSEAGLVAYYNFNDGSGTTLTDVTSGGHDGTLNNMEAEDWVSGAPVSEVVTQSKSLYFSGSAGNQSGIASGFKNLVDSVYTQELWIKPDAYTASWGEAHVLQFVGDYHSQLYLKIKNADTAWVYTQDGNMSWENGTVVTLDKWTHLAYVRDGKEDSARIYINGVLSSTVVLDHDSPTTADSNLVLGLYNGYENGESSYSGLMDELRIWNKALTLEEIQADMVKELNGSEDGLVAYYDFNNQSGSMVKDRSSNSLDVQLKNMDASNWKTENTPFTPPVIPENDELIALWHFDEGSDTIAVDASGNGKDGILKDGAVFADAGVSGSAIEIVGTGHILVPGGGSLDKINEKITIETWVKPSSLSKRNIVLAQWDGSAGQRAYVLYLETDGIIHFMLSPSGDGGGFKEIASTSSIDSTKWNQIVVTSDGDSMRIYINGESDAVSEAPSGGIYVPTKPLYIGDWGWGDVADNTEQYNGLIDEMALYNYAISVDTIKAHYENLNPVGVETITDVPNKFLLHQNYPNPFNPTTVISFALPKASDVQLSVFNILGEKVAQLVDGKMVAGNYNVNFNATNLASGIYIYKLKAGNFSTVKKMILMK